MLVLVAASAASLGAGAPAAWAYQASVESSPATIAYYGPTDPRTTRSIEYRVSLTAGADAESVVIDVENVDSGMVVAGPATLTVVSRSGSHTDGGFPPGPDRCPFISQYFSSARDELILPAGSTSTIAFTRTLRLTSAPVSGDAFVASFGIARTPPGNPGTVGDPLAGEVSIHSPTPKLAGLMPSQLDLHAGLAGSGTAVTGASALNVPRGSRVRISGTLKPARRGDHVTIWDYAPGATVPKPLAVANVDRRGRYQYLRWRPVTLGLWDLYATWPGRHGAVEPVRSACGGPHIIVGAGVPTVPAAAPAGR